MQAHKKIVCSWAKCGINKEVIDMDTGGTTLEIISLEFESKMDWEDHIEKLHLILIAWHLGDGPQATSLGTSSTSLTFSLYADRYTRSSSGNKTRA